MLQKIHQFFIKNPFLKDSGLIFAANIANSLLNYGLVFLVARLLVKAEFAQWVTIGAFIALLTSFFSGVSLFVVKRISSLEHKEKGLGVVYQRFIQFWFFKIVLIIFILSPIFTYLIKLVLLPEQPYWLIFASLNQVFFTFVLGLSQNFLMGILVIKEFAITSILGTVTRLIFTVIMILFGFGTFALPLGAVFSGIVIYFLAENYIKKIKQNSNFHIISEKDKPHFDLKQEFLGSQATAVFLFCLLAIFTLPNFFSDRFLNVSNKDIFATIYSFGQMIHFGPVAFLGALIPHSSRTKDKKIILQATGVTIVLTLVAILFLFLFGGLFLKVLNRQDYQQFLPLIWVYGIFVLGYNIMFVSTQVLIAQSSFKKMLNLILILILNILLLSIIGSNILNFDSNFEILNIFIFANAIFGLLSGFFMLWQVLKD
jgi:O-antigen/teichoic acid export membrane protein